MTTKNTACLHWETLVLPGRSSSARGLPEVDVLSLHVVPSSQALLVSDVVSVANESPFPPASCSAPRCAKLSNESFWFLSSTFPLWEIFLGLRTHFFSHSKEGRCSLNGGGGVGGKRKPDMRTWDVGPGVRLL